MKRLKKRIDHREQILSTALLREDSANRLMTMISRSNVAQLELEHLRILMWTHFLEDLLDDDIDVRTLLGKGEKPIYDEALQILTGEAGWDCSPTKELAASVVGARTERKVAVLGFGSCRGPRIVRPDAPDPAGSEGVLPAGVTMMVPRIKLPCCPIRASSLEGGL